MLEFRDFTFDEARFPRADVVAFADSLAAQGQHYMLIADPAIYCLDDTYAPYARGSDMNIWIRDANTSAPYVGRVWPGYVPCCLGGPRGCATLADAAIRAEKGGGACPRADRLTGKPSSPTGCTRTRRRGGPTKSRCGWATTSFCRASGST